MTQRKTKKKTLASVRCRLNFEDERTFIEKYAPNISKTGIFAKTKKPKAVGEELKFEFLIADGTPVIRGKGEVTWNRRSESSTGAPPGMGIKFVSLDEKGKEMVGKVMSFKKTSGSDFNKPSSYSIAPQMADGQILGAAGGAPLGIALNRSGNGGSPVGKTLSVDEADALLDELSSGASITLKNRARRKGQAAKAIVQQRQSAEDREIVEPRVKEQRAAEEHASDEERASEETADDDREQDGPEEAESISEAPPENLVASSSVTPDAMTGSDILDMLEVDADDVEVEPDETSDDVVEIEPDEIIDDLVEIESNEINGDVVEIEPIENGDEVEVDYELDAASEIPPPPTDGARDSSPEEELEMTQEELEGILEDVYSGGGPEPEPPTNVIQDNELDALLNALEEEDDMDEEEEIEELEELEVLEIEE